MRRILFALLFLLVLPSAWAEDQAASRYIKSYVFDAKLDRITSSIVLKPGSIVDAQNVQRPSPTAMIGWECRSGSTKHHSTAIGAYEVKGLFRHVDKELGNDGFYAQVNDEIYASTTIPPTETTTFGSSIYTMTSGSSPAWADKIGDDIVWVASGTTPWAYSGASAYPDAFYVDHASSGGSVYANGYFYVRDNRDDTYLTIFQATSEYLYIGFRRRISGVYLDFVSGATNMLASGLTVHAYRSGTWTDVNGFSDGTKDTSGVTTCYQSGYVGWTASTADTHHILNYTQDDLYWYRLSVDADVTDGIKVKRARVSDRCEEITNLWSGMYDTALGFLVSTTTGYLDYTAEITAGTDAEYADIGSMTTSDGVFVGFARKTFGIYLKLVSEYVNELTAATVTVSYWNGTTKAWTTVGTVTDGTANIVGSTTYSLNHNGLIQWDGSTFTEDMRQLGGIATPLYWYKLTWSATIPADVRIWAVGQAEKPESMPSIPKYDFMIEHASRALYGPGIYSRHGLDFSSPNYAHILNGPMCGTTGNIFGPGIPNAAARLHSYVVVSTKDPYRLYLLEGKIPGKWDELLISSHIGVLAPKSLIVIEDAVRLFPQDRSVHAAIFMAHDGIYMTDGQTVICISHPISTYWNTSSSSYVEPSYAHLAYAWVDYRQKTVHFAVPMNTTGTTQTTLNRELVYNYITDEWYDVFKRAAPASCGAAIVGSDGQRLTYFGDYAGTVHRDNYGTTDSGAAIEFFVKTSDLMPMEGIKADPLNLSTQLRALRVKGKSGTTGLLEVTAYPDGATTGEDPVTNNLTMVRSGYGYFSKKFEFDSDAFGESFAFKFRSGVTETGVDASIIGFTVEHFPIRETY